MLKSGVLFLGGTPGSGKTTWVKENISQYKDFKVLEFDKFVRCEKEKGVLSGFDLYQKALSEITNELFSFLKKGEKIIFDFTFLRKNHRQKIFNSLKKDKIKFSGVWVNSSFLDGLKRNRNREFNLPIENQILFHCCAEIFEKNEGFDEIFFINDEKKFFKQEGNFFEVKKFLKDKKKYKGILNFPEIFEIKEELEFFNVDLSNILQKDGFQKDLLYKFYSVVFDFYFQKLQFNGFYKDIKDDFSEECFRKQFFKKIVNIRCGKNFF